VILLSGVVLDVVLTVRVNLVLDISLVVPRVAPFARILMSEQP